jgi:hypothetical protein
MLLTWGYPSTGKGLSILLFFFKVNTSKYCMTKFQGNGKQNVYFETDYLNSGS